MLALLIAASLAATPLNINTEIAAAHPGDTVVMTGTFDHVLVTGKTGVTFDATAATIANFKVVNGTGITLNGGLYKPTAWDGAVYVIQSTNVSVNGIQTLDAGLYDGVMFRNSTNVSLINSNIDHATTAVTLLNVTGATISGNALLRSAGDGIDVSTVHNATIDHNICAGNLLLNPAIHPDCVQLWSTQGQVPTSNITVSYNIAYGATQGFDGFDHPCAADPAACGGFDNIVFDHNFAMISYPQGVALYDSRGGAVTNNEVFTLPGSTYQTSTTTSGNTDVSVCGNTIAAYVRWAARKDPPCSP